MECLPVRALTTSPFIWWLLVRVARKRPRGSADGRREVSEAGIVYKVRGVSGASDCMDPLKRDRRSVQAILGVEPGRASTVCPNLL